MLSIVLHPDLSMVSEILNNFHFSVEAMEFATGAINCLAAGLNLAYRVLLLAILLCSI